MKAEKELFRRLRIEYIDAEGKERHFALTPAIMQIKDIVYLKRLIDALRDRCPELAQHIVDIAELIVEANTE